MNHGRDHYLGYTVNSAEAMAQKKSDGPAIYKDVSELFADGRTPANTPPVKM